MLVIADCNIGKAIFTLYLAVSRMVDTLSMQVDSLKNIGIAFYGFNVEIMSIKEICGSLN